MKIRIVLVVLGVVFGSFSPAFAVAPATPSGLSVSSASPANSATDQALAKVVWTAVSGASFYRITATAGTETILEQVPGGQAAGTQVEYVFPSSQLAESNKGLSGGTTYSFSIRAVNSSDEQSPATSVVTHLAQSVPAAPTTVSATAGVGQATITWSAPSNTGGQPITSYKIEATGIDQTALSTDTSKVITGLQAGTKYTFTIKAKNDLGFSAAATFSEVTIPTVPGAPTSVTASKDGTKVSASWTAPSSNGGSSITGYKAFLINSAGTDVGDPVSVTTTSADFTNVATGTYTVKVVATNVAGDSARSEASSSVTISSSASLLANDPVITTTPANLTSLEIGKTTVVSATSPSQTTVTITVSANPANACSLENSTITAGTVGTCTINASVDGTTQYNSGTSQKSFNVVKKSQSINFAPIGNQTLPGPLIVSATSDSGLIVSFTAAPVNICTHSGADGTVINLLSNGICTVTAQQAGDANFAAAQNVSRSFSITSSAGGASGTGGGGGGGGGGGAVKQTALYFKIVDPNDESKLWNKRGCVSVYSRDLSPQFLGSGCADESNNINILSADAKVSIRVYEFGYGDVFREYLGEVGGDKFTMTGASYFPGTTRWAVSVAKISSSPTPSPSPTPTQSPTPIATPTPVPTPSITPVPTPTPKPTPTPTPTPTPIASPTPTPSTSKVSNTFFQVTKSTKNLNKLTLRSIKSSTSLKVGRSIQLIISSVGAKSVRVGIKIKTPQNKSYLISPAVLVAKNKAFKSPIIRFLKPGTYVLTTSIGSSSRVLTVKVAK